MNKHEVPSKEEFDSLMLDFMLDHKIDHSHPDHVKDATQMLCNLVIATLQAKNMKVHKNWCPKSMKQRYIRTDDFFEKFIRDIPGVGQKAAKAVQNKARMEDGGNDLIGMYNGFEREGILWLSRVQGAKVGQALSNKIFKTFMASDVNQLV